MFGIDAAIYVYCTYVFVENKNLKPEMPQTLWFSITNKNHHKNVNPWHVVKSYEILMAVNGGLLIKIEDKHEYLLITHEK